MKLCIKRVKTGMVLSEAVYGASKVYPLIPAGEVLTEEFINKLKRNGIDYVQIRFQKELNETLSDDLQDSLAESLMKFEVKDIIDNAKQMVTSILNTKYLSFSLSKYYIEAEEKTDIFKHSVNVAAFAVAIGKVYNQSLNTESAKVNLDTLAVSAMMHDIGKLCRDEAIFKDIDKVALRKDIFPNYSDDVYLSFDEHNSPIYGYAMLNNLSNLSSVVKLSVLLQGENELGEGILGVNSNFMQNNHNSSVVISKIINVADWYERLIEVIIKLGMSPSNVIEMMNQQKVTGRVSKTFTDILLKSVPIYSVGCLVVLSNGKIAKVTALNDYALDKPVVTDVETNEVYDLLNIRNVTITKVVEIDPCNLNKSESLAEDEPNRSR